MRRYLYSAIAVSVALAMTTAFSALAANDLPRELDITDEQAKPIIDHMPTKAAVKPAKPRRLLVYIQTDQFRTPGEPYVNPLVA